PYKVAQVTSARLGCHFQSQWNETFCGIDVGIRDGEWHTVTRDVAADLHEVFPDADMSAITRLSIRASGQIDDIKFISRDAISFYTISGNIALDGNTLSGVKLTGGGNCQPSDDNGNFQCSVPQDWFGSLVPKKDGYIFEPFSLVYENIASDQTANIIAKPIPTSDDEPILHWTRDMHPITGNGAVKLPNWFEDYVDGEYTVTISATPTASKSNNYLFYVSQAYIATDKDYPSIKLDAENRVQFNMAGEVITSEPIPLNETIQVAITWNGADFTGYVNGKVIGSLSIENYKYGSLTIIGWNANAGDAFEGEISEVKIYKKAITFLCSDIEEIPLSQCQTLVDLNDNTSGENWTNNEGWNVTNTPCSWYGIECTDGNVTKIALENNNLVGTIPNLSALTELKTLVFDSNQGITGNFPDISQLSKLYHFSAGQTDIGGTLPANIVNATSLRELGISETQLTGELPDLSQLPNLQQLNLGNSQFTGEIPTLPSGLTLLNLAGNSLCRNSNTNYGYTEVEAFPICGEQPPEPIIAEPIIDGNTVTLDASNSIDPDPNGEITSYIWTTDEGETEIGVNPTIEFATEGEHTVTLIAVDNTGLISNKVEQQITIGPEISDVPEPPLDIDESEIPEPAPIAEIISLTLKKRGTGSGLISLNGSIECTEMCGRYVENYDVSTEVELQVVPSPDSIFIGWDRNCGNTTDLIINLTVDKKLRCIAYFELDPTKQLLHRVKAIKIGHGYGDVIVINPNGVVTDICSSPTCVAKFYATDTEITLRARNRSKSTFVGWGEDCAVGGYNETITITIDKATNCTAQFDLTPPIAGQYILTVDIGQDTMSPSGGYVVSGSNINCGYDCKEIYNQDSAVKLIAVPDSHSYFVRWEDNCEG
ncbi:MAG: PKD domain-containing protein, partial [Proteobacteria bacterium]|nr:PKD domain-containing protein [Pseudomonadota bacterium]